MQRHDAQQIQALSSIEDKLYALADALGQERKHVFNLRGSDRTSLQSQQQYTSASIVSDNSFHKTLNIIAADNVPLMPRLLDDQLKNNIDLNSAYLKQLNENLLVHRAELNERSVIGLNSVLTDNAVRHFDRYSNLIAEIGSVRKDLQFAPSIANQEAQYHAYLIDSIWVLKESNLQIVALLENILHKAKYGDTEIDIQAHYKLLQTLIYRTASALEEINVLGRRHQFSDSIEAKKQLMADHAGDNYLVVNNALLDSLLENALVAEDLERWSSSANAIQQLAHAVRAESSAIIRSEIGGVETQATTNLIIDSFLLLLCSAMALLSLQYFRRMHCLAHRDELTMLNNRRSFSMAAQKMLESAKSADEHLAILFIDLDRFKHINDSMGHAVGDQLLQAVSKRLVSCCSHESHIARIGGDEFAILKKYSYKSDLDSFAASISQHIREPYNIDRGFLQIGASIGIGHYPSDATNVSELMKNADLAMYCAKTLGRNKIVSFNAELRADYEHKVNTESDLQLALREEQFELYYQPKFNVTAGYIDSVEALIRWNHPERGMIPPDDFIPIAEECGLLQLMGMWVLEQACKQAAVWLETGEQPLRVAVNVSADQFLQPHFVSDVQMCLQKYKLPAEYLELELTESVVMNDVDLVVNSLRELRDTGIKIALDDFGTGYSSLSYLQNLPIDTLKIDKSFIQNMGLNKGQHGSIAQTVAVLADSLGLDTVAEGVETSDQLSAVTSMGISSVQGYFYSKPLDAVKLQKAVFEINQVNGHKPHAA